MTGPSTRRLISRVELDGELVVCMQSCEIASLRSDELLVEVDAAPVNPADLKSIFCGLAHDALINCQVEGEIAIRGRLGPEAMPSLAWRVGQDMPVGNEGTGIVVAAGDGEEAQSLLGKRVATASVGMFAENCIARVSDCIVLSPTVSPEAGAGAFINPMTALAMLETMRRENHTGLALTAAGSNLGKILNRVCLADGVPLVNIVRSQEGVAALENLRARYICNSSDPDFASQLVEALAETGATIAFDATGGGVLAGRILYSMEMALLRNAASHDRYGTAAKKQIYFFGGLDPSPVTFSRNFGMAWSVGGWLLQSVLATLEPATVSAMKDRVRDQLGTHFASTYGATLGLQEFMRLENIRKAVMMKTGGKTLLTP